ncbi:hypothetical protein LCGC14_1821030 [marine sediment metagenome]|uniref:Uncharacterized protein n=1 Tax=marine sediment metagenome TaxID=412755 RepID=A0A0F9GJ55_9ZZZZ
MEIIDGKLQDEAVTSNAIITGGTIDGTVIGGTTPAAGTFTTLKTTGAVIFNEAGADVDFRVEGVGNVNALFVQGSDGFTGFGTNTPSTLVELKITNNDAHLNMLTITKADTSGVSEHSNGILFKHASYNGNGALVYPTAQISGVVEAWSGDITNGGTGGLVFSTKAASTLDLVEHMRISSKGDIGIKTSLPSYILDVAGNINQRSYFWCEDFDYEAAAVEFESGLQADAWVTAGTNYASGNVTYTAGIGGTLEAKCAAADNDSVIITGLANIAIDSNPVLEARIKIDDISTAFFCVGFVEGSFVDKTTPDDDIFVVGIDSDNAHGFGATQIVSLDNDNGGGVNYDDMGVVAANGTYIKIKIDLTDTEKPRVWINDSEVGIASINGTVQAGITVSPYIMVQNLTGGAIQRAVTVDYIKVWQDRG